MQGSTVTAQYLKAGILPLGSMSSRVIILAAASTKESDSGEAIIFKEGFPTSDGKALFVPTNYQLNTELPDNNYPLILITGRILEHWHTGSMTRKSKVLNHLKPQSFLAINPKDAKKIGISSGDNIILKSKRGSVKTLAKLDSNLQIGNVFMPFCFVEAAANIITRDDIDPNGKIPAFKYCWHKKRFAI
jgi:formate dehydrogenase major subunit